MEMQILIPYWLSVTVHIMFVYLSLIILWHKVFVGMTILFLPCANYILHRNYGNLKLMFIVYIGFLQYQLYVLMLEHSYHYSSYCLVLIILILACLWLSFVMVSVVTITVIKINSSLLCNGWHNAAASCWDLIAA